MGVLQVTVERAAGLAPKAPNSCNPYVRVELEQYERRRPLGQTFTVRHSVSPSWAGEEGSLFEARLLSHDATLRFDVLDEDWLGSDLLGSAVLPLGSVPLTPDDVDQPGIAATGARLAYSNFRHHYLASH
jgi:hypothetical protein